MADLYRKTLEEVQQGRLGIEEAMQRLKKEPFADIGVAKVDFHRKLRKGAQEVIYGAGKTAEQITAILQAMKERQALPVLVTRLEEEKAAAIQQQVPEFCYHPEGKVGIMSGGIAP